MFGESRIHVSGSSESACKTVEEFTFVVRKFFFFFSHSYTLVKVMTVLVIVLLVLWGLFCFAIGIAFGIIQNITNLLLAAAMVIGCVSAIMLFKWWRAQDLDPKFRVLLLLLIAQVLLLGVALNVNIWVDRCPAKPADACTAQKLPIYVATNVSTGNPRVNCFAYCASGYGYDFTAPNPQCIQLNISNSQK